MYNEQIPVITNELAPDVSGMQMNFAELRRHFLNGVIPIDGSEIDYGYDPEGDVITVSILVGGTEVASCAYTYDGNGNMTNEDWVVDGNNYALVYSYSGGNMIKTTIAIT